MFNKKSLFVLALGVSLVAGTWAAGRVEENALAAQAGAAPSGAVIEKVNPINVLPGTLVSVEGSGFGTVPRAIKVGNQTISTFLGWEDTAVFFRLPAAVSDGDVVQIGNAVAPDGFKPAPAGSITVQFTIDTSKVDTTSFNADQRAKLTGPLTFQRPLFVKGEWIKTNANSWGNREASWDGGSKYRMVQAKDPKFWIAEAVFTPANIDTFKLPSGAPRVMKFAFEDGNDTQRNLVEFESDWAFALKKGWATTDLHTTIHSDPGIELRTTYQLYNRDANKIYAVFPVAR